MSDSSTGFELPNGARRSPDVAWTLRSRVEQLDPASREGFWRLCPDFIIELRSPHDRARAVREKMLERADNGARLAWLLEPAELLVTIYRSGSEPVTLKDVGSVAGEAPVEGFVLSLPAVWDPLHGE